MFVSSQRKTAVVTPPYFLDCTRDNPNVSGLGPIGGPKRRAALSDTAEPPGGGGDDAKTRPCPRPQPKQQASGFKPCRWEGGSVVERTATRAWLVHGRCSSGGRASDGSRVVRGSWLSLPFINRGLSRCLSSGDHCQDGLSLRKKLLGSYVETRFSESQSLVNRALRLAAHS